MKAIRILLMISLRVFVVFALIALIGFLLWGVLYLLLD